MHKYYANVQWENQCVVYENPVESDYGASQHLIIESEQQPWKIFY
jgi:hypothetical protein